jgi:hypothetical protein
MVEVTIAIMNCLAKGIGSLSVFLGERKTAGQVVVNQWIIGTKTRQPTIHMKTIFKSPTPCIIITQKLKSFHIASVALDNPL